MTDITELQNDLANVRTHVENLERMVAFQIRGNKEAKADAIALFSETPDLGSIYLAFAEPKSQLDVRQALTMDKSKVSRLVTLLCEHDFLRKLPNSRYMWTEFHKLLGLQRIASAAAAPTEKVGRNAGPQARGVKRARVANKSAIAADASVNAVNVLDER